MGGVGGILATVQRHNFNSYVCLVIFFRRAANSSSIARNIDFSFFLGFCHSFFYHGLIQFLAKKMST